MIKNGGSVINQKIKETLEKGEHLLRVSGEYEIEEAIRIPSDFTLILEDAYLRLGDGTFTNVFVNESCRKESNYYAEGADHNITLLGIGRAIVDGGVWNGLNERNSGKDGMPSVLVNNLLLFINVDGFRVEGIQFRHQRWWACDFKTCRHGMIRNLDFCAHDLWMDENGELQHGLGVKRFDDTGFARYDEPDSHFPYVRTADGIDIRSGCHDIIIENITGFAEDDFIALTALGDGLVKDLPMNIYNIIIRNVNGSSYSSLVRILNQSGHKIYNVLVDGIFDASADCPYITRGGHAVRIGDNHAYGTRFANEDETENIAIKNVYSRQTCILRLCGKFRNLQFSNFNVFADGGGIVNHTEYDVKAFFRDDSLSRIPLEEKPVAELSEVPRKMFDKLETQYKKK